MYFIPQLTDHDCGLACLKMLLAEIYHDDNYLYLKEDENLKYYSYSDLIDIARSHGITLEGFKVQDKKQFKMEGNYPYIVTIGKGDHPHAVIVEKTKLGRVFIYDPSKGKYSLSISRFISIWDGTLLMVQDVDELESVIKVPDVTVKKKTFLPTVLSICSASSLMAGLFFLNDSYHVLLPIIFLLMYILLELGSKFVMILSLSSIDEQCLKIGEIKKQYQYTFFERLQTYKKYSLSNPINLLTTLIISIFVVIITIINNTTNIILVVTPLCLSFVECFIFKPWKQDKEDSINLEEKALFEYDEEKLYLSNVKRIHKKTYNLSIKILLKKYSFFFVMVVSSFICMMLNSTSLALPFVIFNFSIQLVLLEYFSVVFSFEEKKLIFLRSKARLINTVMLNDGTNETLVVDYAGTDNKNIVNDQE